MLKPAVIRSFHIGVIKAAMSIPNDLNLLKLGYAIHGRSAENSPIKQCEVLLGIREYAKGAMIEHHHVVAMRFIDRN